MALKPWIWGSIVVSLGVFAAAIAGLVIDSRQQKRAAHLSVELEMRRSEFVRRWSGTRWHKGPPCNALTVASDVLDRATAVDSKETLRELQQAAAPCSEAFALDALSYKDRPVIDDFRYMKAVLDLLVHEMEGPDCLPGVLDVLDLADALRVGGGIRRLRTAREVEWEGLSAGLDCVGRSSLEQLRPLAERAVKSCTRPSYISGAVEWEFLESTYDLQVLFRRRSWIPRFWDPALAPLSNGRTLLDGQEQLLGYASRAAASASHDYPALSRELQTLVDDSAKSLAHFRSFGPAHPTRTGSVPLRELVTADQNWVAQRRAFGCGIFKLVHGLESQCPEACSDPYSGEPLSLSIRDGKITVYAVGKDGKAQDGEGDDQGVAFFWPLRPR